MVFIWKGWGWLTLVFAAAALLAAIGIARSIDPDYPEHLVGGASVALGGGLTAACALLVLPTLTRRRTPDAGVLAVQRMHTLFFIPMIWWSLILVGLGLIWVLFGAERPVGNTWY